jgi:RNA recognition motif-containing protein
MDRGQQMACYRLISVVDYKIAPFHLNRVIKESFMNLYVGNLSYSVTEEDLKEAFSEFGELESVNIIKDKYSGQSKGFGFVEMPDNAEADKAIKALNGNDLKGRAIKVNQAKPRGERSSRRPRY